ncbi:MAG: class I SAM-dependent methyltransferase, partial [Nocardioidaceae bacterium]
CWRAIDGAGRDGLASEELAAAIGIHPRYAREWLEAMATGGFLVVRDAVDARRFALADGVQEVLVDIDSDAYLMPLLRQVAASTRALPALEAAYRSGGGVRWDEHDVEVRDAQGDMNRRQLRDHLSGWVVQHLPDIAARLAAGGRVADVGTGYGWAAVGLATAFEAATVDAYDLDEASVVLARRNVLDAGLADRVTVRLDGIGGIGAYDLVVMAEMLHDVPDPVGVLRAAAGSLAPGGALLVADMRVADEFSPGVDDVDDMLVERMMYGFSLLVCLPDAMAYRPTMATGTVMRDRVLKDYVAQAGLEVVEEPAIPHDTWRFWRLRATADRAGLTPDAVASA